MRKDPDFYLVSSRTRRRSNHSRCFMPMTSQWEFPELLTADFVSFLMSFSLGISYRGPLFLVFIYSY
jgi:hypothetical protein